MDLGCIDMGCVEKLRNGTPPDKGNGPKESLMSASKLGKNNKAKDVVRSSINALNKLTSQISKPPRRKTSPINWFPRKKVEPYLKRKIKMLQEVDGMNSTLDETLGDSNPHYCRVLREKIAIKEAAEKAMEAQKTAMVEASWCRILQAARIESKEAEAELSKAEACAAEAFEAAREAGVTMNDIPDCSQNHFKIETTSAKEGSATHTVSATFETAFEVDKQVASAVKAAFIKLANCPSINKVEFKELLRRISENPDTDDNYNNDLSSECESGTGSEQKKQKERCKEESENYNLSNIVDMMLGRLQCLKEEELSSLATIVATRGLNAALAETENLKQHKIESTEHNPTVKVARRTSVARGRVTADTEIPSLDKFLVKKLTRLEREVLEAKSARNNEAAKDNGSEQKLLETKVELKEEGGCMVEELGSVLMKRSSKLEKEIEKARTSGKRSSFEMENNKVQGGCKKKQEVEEIPSLDKYLVKRLTRLERDVQEAKNRNKLGHSNGDLSKGKENTDVNKVVEDGNYGENYESLDKVLVKRVSRLEKEKLEFCADEQMRVKHKRQETSRELENGEGSLDQVMVKHTSRLQREKMAANEEHEGGTRHLLSRRQAREKELQAAWGGLSLGNSIRPHVSRLQKDKDAWLKADEEERKREMEEVLL